MKRSTIVIASISILLLIAIFIGAFLFNPSQGDFDKHMQGRAPSFKWEGQYRDVLTESDFKTLHYLKSKEEKQLFWSWHTAYFVDQNGTVNPVCWGWPREVYLGLFGIFIKID